MASEVQFRGPGVGRTCYVVIRNRVNQVWNTSGGTGAFENFLSGMWTQYAISATEQGVTNNYAATMPSAVPPGVYNITAYQQVGGSVDQLDPGVAAGAEQWNGNALMPLSDTVTSGQIANFLPVKISRGVMVSAFPFKLVSSLDHVTPFVSGVVSGQISRDGGAFGALQSGNVTETGLGWYRVTLTSGDLLANTVALSFSSVGISGGNADQRDFGLVLQRSSGQAV